MIVRLRQGLRPGQRAIGIGEELPPNVLMRFGLADARNYDSVELGRSLKWLEPLYEPAGEARTSRRRITWEGVLRARDRLREACVAAVVGPDRPPPELAPRSSGAARSGSPGSTRRTGSRPASKATVLTSRRSPNRITIDVRVELRRPRRDPRDLGPGMDGPVDGRTTRPDCAPGHVPGGRHRSGKHIIELTYHPIDVTYGLFGSAAGVLAVILALTGSARSLNSWNTADGAWTDPSPRVRIEIVN